MNLELIEVDNLAGHDQTVWHASFSRSKLLPLLATCGADKTVRVWKYNKDEDDQSKGSAEAGNSSIADSNSKSARKSAWVQVALLEEVQNRTIRSCEFSPNGRYIASASFDATIAIWELANVNDLSKWRVVAMLEGHENEVKSVSWSPSGALLASCSRDKSVWIWDTSSTTGEANILNDDDSDDNENTVSALGNKNKSSSSSSFECVSVLPGHSQDVKYVQWHPNEDILLSCGYDDTVRIWMEGVNDWFTTANLTGHANTVWNASFNAKGDRFATCSQDCSVIVWSYNKDHVQDASMAAVKGTPQWEPIQVVENVHSRSIYSIDWNKSVENSDKSSDSSLKLFKDNQFLVTGGGDNAISVLVAEKMIEEGEETESKFYVVFQKENAHDSDVNCVRWHPYISNMIVSTSDDGSVKIWRLQEKPSSMEVDTEKTDN